MTDQVIAQICHEANRIYCESLGDFSQPEWDEAPEWQRKSAVDGIWFRIKNPDAPASAQHDSWMQAKLQDGWKYGELKDPGLKTHPCLVAFEELPKEQQKKDLLFAAIVKALT